MEEVLRVVYGVCTAVLLSGAIGIGLVAASQKLAVKKDPLVEAIEAILPGLDCGGCGYPGCLPYAEALGSGDDGDVKKCRPGKNEAVEKILHLLKEKGNA